MRENSNRDLRRTENSFYNFSVCFCFHPSKCVLLKVRGVSVVSGKGEDTYPDLLALFIALLVTVIIALGVKNSVKFNNILNVVNLVVWVFIIISGLFFLSASNWEGGQFLPYGWSGVSLSTVGWLVGWW